MSTVFGVAFYCLRARSPMCSVLNLPVDTDCVPFEDKFGGMTFAEPSVLIIALVAGLTAVVSSMKVWRNKDSRGSPSDS
jgi:hypothetical protein